MSEYPDPLAGLPALHRAVRGAGAFRRCNSGALCLLCGPASTGGTQVRTRSAASESPSVCFRAQPILLVTAMGRVAGKGRLFRRSAARRGGSCWPTSETASYRGYRGRFPAESSRLCGRWPRARLATHFAVPAAPQLPAARPLCFPLEESWRRTTRGNDPV